MGKKRKPIQPTMKRVHPHQNTISILNSKTRRHRIITSVYRVPHVLDDLVENMMNSEYQYKKAVNPNFFKTTLKNVLKKIKEKIFIQEQRDWNFSYSQNLTEEKFFYQLLKLAREQEIWNIAYQVLNEKILEIQEIYVPNIKMRQRIRDISRRVMQYMEFINHNRIEQAFEICFGKKNSKQLNKMYVLNRNNEENRRKSANQDPQQ